MNEVHRSTFPTARKKAVLLVARILAIKVVTLAPVGYATD